MFFHLVVVMRPSKMSNVLLISFDESQKSLLDMLRNRVAEQEGGIQTYYLNEVHGLFSDDSNYTRKLEMMLDCVTAAFLITSQKLSDINEPRGNF